MAGIKGNRRIIYTKKIIQQSLIDLLQSKKIHEITVTDICKKSDINRGTFYNHYKDAYDLLQSLEDEFFNQISEYIESTPIEAYKDVLLLKVTELIKENKELCKILFNNNIESNIMNRIIYLANKAEIDKLINNPKVNPVYIDYFIKHSVGGIFYVIKSWLDNDLKETPKEIVTIINEINHYIP